jgi:hypothetical protein
LHERRCPPNFFRIYQRTKPAQIAAVIKRLNLGEQFITLDFDIMILKGTRGRLKW